MGRIIILIYGILAYVLFLVAFLYLVGFVTNFFGQSSAADFFRGVDDPPMRSGASVWLINLGLIALFGVQHSVMARRGFKKWWTNLIPQPAERSTFVLATVLILGLMYWQWRAMPQVIWTADAPALRWTLFGVGALGWLIVLLSTFLIDHFELFGLKQVIAHARGRELRSHRFVTPAFYRYVRHPLYLGFLLAFWITPDMTVGHLFFASGFTVYILIAIVFEERDLIHHFGEQYVAYRKRVAMIVPHPFKRRPPHTGRGAGPTPT